MVLRLVCFAAIVLALTPLRADESARPAPLMRDFMGVNGHFAFKPELYRPTCGLVRNYHSTVWDLGDDTALPPTFPLARNRVDWSTVYGSWLKSGFRIDACLQVESIKPTQWKNLPADTRAYGEAFAKYFGPSGHNLVESVEIGNEPASYDAPTYRTVFENMARGLRAGDPKLKIAGACANASKPDQYSKDVTVFSGLEDLYDVLDMLRYRDEHAPGKEVWITEFGYDAGTKKPGPGTFEKWVSSTETEQAQWITRSFLMFSSLGVDRAYVYYFDDQDEPKLHASSGLTRHFVPKPAYYAMAHLYRTLGDYRFSRVIAQKTDDLFIFEYVNPDKPREPVWVAWSPTGTQREVSQTIPVTGTVQRAERMPLKDGPAENVTFQQNSAGVTLSVGESPVYLWLSANP
jgi:serine/threonine-protein kinase ATR